MADEWHVWIQKIGPEPPLIYDPLGRWFLVSFKATMDLSQECIDDYASLTSEAGEYVFENGRRYHGYKSGRGSFS